MSTRKRFRELIARGRLVPMPGAYDALSAKIMEAEGFENAAHLPVLPFGEGQGDPEVGAGVRVDGSLIDEGATGSHLHVGHILAGGAGVEGRAPCVP